jgi:hypothetical protein
MSIWTLRTIIVIRDGSFAMCLENLVSVASSGDVAVFGQPIAVKDSRRTSGRSRRSVGGDGR